MTGAEQKQPLLEFAERKYKKTDKSQWRKRTPLISGMAKTKGLKTLTNKYETLAVILCCNCHTPVFRFFSTLGLSILILTSCPSLIGP